MLRSHVLPVKLALSPEQRLSKTTCSSVSGDYLLCPRRCQIIKHLHPLSPCPQSPQGSLLLRLDVWRYKAAFIMSCCDSPPRGFTNDTYRGLIFQQQTATHFKPSLEREKKKAPTLLTHPTLHPFIDTILMIIRLE